MRKPKLNTVSVEQSGEGKNKGGNEVGCKNIQKTPTRARGVQTKLGKLGKPENQAELSEMLRARNGRERAVDALLAGLEATRRFWSKEADGYVEEPDHATRGRIATEILAYSDGRPVERSEIVNVNVDTVQELERRAALSPALRRSLEKIVSKLPNGELQKGVEIPTEAETSETDVTKTDQLL